MRAVSKFAILLRTISSRTPSRSRVSGPGSRGGFQLYTVKPGDGLSKIASEQQFGSTTAKAIFAANRDQLHDPDLIHPGQVLRIPLGGS